ncbi:MAG: metallophosphoesterase [Bacillota bacterium]
MKYIFFALNIFCVLLAHLLLFLIWRDFFGIDSRYVQVAVSYLLLGSVSLLAIAPLLMHWRDSVFSRSLYLVLSLWMGVMLNTALIALVMLIADWFAKSFGIEVSSSLRPYAIGILPILILLPEAWAAQSFRIKRRTVYINGLPPIWEGKDIVHISDIHLGPIWRQRHFDRLVAAVNGLQPDATFITGDLFDGMDTDFHWFHPRQFQAEKGVYYSIGNHDLNLGTQRIKDLLSNSGIEIMDNRLLAVDGLQILGLTCHYEGKLDVKSEILSQIGYERALPSILMYHEPKDIPAARSAGINLQLSGHTHAGQMFPLNLLAMLLFKGFSYGLFRLKEYTISVTAGAGTWGPPLRLGSRSEIVVLRLKTANK